MPANKTYGAVLRELGDISSVGAAGAAAGMTLGNPCPAGQIVNFTSADAESGYYTYVPHSVYFAHNGSNSMIGRAITVLDSHTCDPNANIVAQCVIGIGSYQTFWVKGIDVNSTNLVSFKTDSIMSSPNTAISVLRPTNDYRISGFVYIQVNSDSTVTFTAVIKGLDNTIAHGIHIHAYGDLMWDNGTSVGPHWKGANQTHGLPPADNRELGDLGNICVYDEDGVAYYKYSTSYSGTLSSAVNFVGRSIVIHAIRDSGNLSALGARLAQGVIGITTNPIPTPLPNGLNFSSEPLVLLLLLLLLQLPLGQLQQ
ncbi:hypothetical protein SAMD00019534_111890 [Acytostelium subglobosum LB1]|uniref:hypothetical protein n=1 Tax=Acytostelium subglobosum LB1 TaxID=1410327 RepID=UPI0006448569|nr:hypothetical protein SAMD00019534_111890 [Acytostelium subglobosum LB1]GAM28013.1 hypothetical protein SAMD00019534_111890 [Acytostelium subglobosum LB1]|eukprot:XP_012748972.1 hypothetical protein SAMD00019534_111890 [Acytostelium subglobosum LB1]